MRLNFLTDNIHDVVVQLIADGAHLAPETILTVWRAARGRIALVSDVTAAGGMGDGSFLRPKCKP